MTTDNPFRGWRVTTKVFNEIYEPLSSCRLGSMAQLRGWLQGFSVQGGAKKCQAGQPALRMRPGEEPWPEVSGWPSVARVPSLSSRAGSGFKFWVTVSVAPRPEDSDAKWGGE